MTLWESVSGLFSALGQLFTATPPNAPPRPPAPPIPPWTPPPTPEPNETMIALLEEHNSFRRNNGLQPLTMVEQLNRAAQRHADWMAVNRNMSHSEKPGTQGFDATDFSQRIKREGYLLSSGGENIAAGQRAVPEVMDDWMNSPGHRANILNAGFWNVGFGVAKDTFGHIYWCVVFATPLSRSRAVLRVRVQVVVSLPRALVHG